MPGEFCDDGDTSDLSKCNSTCSGEVIGWTCTLGSPTTASNCVSNCSDGIKTTNEACDEGVNLSDDVGCESDCSAVQLGFICTGNNGELSICHPDCGDG